MAIVRKLALPIIAGVGLIWLAVPAIAQQQGEIVVTGKVKLPKGHEPVETVVDIKDLDLATPEGVSKMEKRVEAAIKGICAKPPRAAHWEVQDRKACTDFAWSNAKLQMDEAIQRAQGG